MSRQGRAFSSGRLFKEKRGDGPERWVLDYRAADGMRKRLALSTDKRVAERMRADLIRKRDLEMAGLGSEEGQDIKLADLNAQYLADLATSASDRHVSMTKSRLDRIVKDISATYVRDVTPMALIRLRSERLAAKCSVRTVNLDAATMRAMFSWAVRAGLMAANPLANFARLPEREATQRRKRRAMSEEEITRFLAASREDDAHCARLFPRVPQTSLFRILVECGSRYGETICTCWSDLDVERRVLRLRAETTKSRRERQIPLRADLVTELLRLREQHAIVLRRPTTPRDRIFLSPTGEHWKWQTVNLMRVFVRILEDAEIDQVDQSGRKLDLHALRHTAATRLARNGVPLAITQRILGHSDPKLTARVYSHLEVDDLRDAVEGLGRHDDKRRTAESA